MLCCVGYLFIYFCKASCNCYNNILNILLCTKAIFLKYKNINLNLTFLVNFVVCFHSSSDQTTQPTCTTCTPGYYCLRESVTYTDQVCPSGYYCPLGTRHAFEFPCPMGSYNPVNGSDSHTDCLVCPPGKFCECELLNFCTLR